MKLCAMCCVLLLMSAHAGLAASRQHSVTLGKWTTIKLGTDDENGKSPELKIRPVIVDGHDKEWTTGPLHDVTERTFVAQRVYRLNDSLPQEPAIRWRWELGAWLLVDRLSGKVHLLNLPVFDPYASQASWFRDYAAYCGSAEDGQKKFAVLVQMGRRKPLLKKAIAATSAGDEICPAPKWERDPARVTFAPKNDVAFTYTINTRVVDAAAIDEDKDDEGEQ